MKACWMFVILTGCWMSTVTQTWSSCTCELQTVCLPAGHGVVVPCPKLTKEMFRFSLLMNHQLIHSEDCNNDKKALNCTPTYSRAGVEVLSVKIENGSISFKLTEVNASSHGAYRCKGTELFPPPLRPPVYAVGKLVLVEGHQCRMNPHHKDPPTDIKGSWELSWIWILVLVSVIIYSVIITVCASFCWIKLKKSDSQSDYMNTKPRASRGHRKNRGVQNPVPRFL